MRNLDRAVWSGRSRALAGTGVRLTLVASLALAVAGTATANVRFPRHPAPSPDGRLIAFSWQGDIWTVPAEGGLARRLTAHPGYDAYPRWSPDGTRIAFTSDRTGNNDVFVIPVAGGESVQLTFHDGTDRAEAFTADGSGVLFSTYRELYEFRLSGIHVVPITGGTSVRALPSVADHVAVRDGGAIVFSRGATAGTWWRQGYDGPAARELWIHPGGDARVEPFQAARGQDTQPSWSSALGAVVFLSERDGTYNVWMATGPDDAAPLTRFDDDGVRFPRVSRGSDLIAFERDLDLWTLRPGGEPVPIEIHAPADAASPTAETLSVSRADELAVSPDGKEIAFVFRGDIYVRRAEADATAVTRLTRSPGRDHQISWLPDSRAIVFASDRDGQSDLHRIEAAIDGERLVLSARFRITRLTSSPEEESRPRVSPSGDRIAYVRGLGDLVVADVDGGSPRVVSTNFQRPEFAWSPDGRWLAFTRTDDDFNTDIFVASVDDDAGPDDVVPINVTRHPDPEGSPIWSADGRKLAFAGKRRYDGDSDIWFVWLLEADDEKTSQDVLDEALREDDEPEAVSDEESAEDEEPSPRVEINFEDIHRRLRRVTSFPGDERSVVLADDGETFVFAARTGDDHTLWKVRWDGEKLERLAAFDDVPAGLVWSPENERAYFTTGGAIESVDLEGKTESYRTRGRARIDLVAERRQIYEEAWRVLATGFYDADHHGTDWDRDRETYRRVAEAAAHPADFRDALRMLIGELNSSHTQIYDPPAEGPGVMTGHLGIVPDPLPDDRVRVAEVLPESPAARVSSRLEVGDVLVSIDDHELARGDNLYRWLEGTDERSILVGVERDGERFDVRMRPESRSRYRDRVYERDVRASRARVEESSDGRLGYINLRNMGTASARQFERELYAVAHGKEGLVIDVRDNSGGWITDILLSSILAGDHAVTVAREGGPGYPTTRRLIYAWTKPIIVLINETTFSNGEIFARAVQTLGRGKLVGQPTFGGVISTSQVRLLDGSRVRRPNRGWYAKRGSTLDEMPPMERNPCVPDVRVENAPDDAVAGRDPQLDRAVRELMAELGD